MLPSGDMLPTFFVIGAPKCGTTSLHLYLDEHPQIAMTAEKEPFVLVATDWRRELSRYASLFTSAAPVRGESSTVYSQHPQYPGVPDRIAEAVPSARFVYVVRDPVDRAVAHYRQHVANGKESRPLAEALSDYREPGSLYLCASRYATQLRLYLDRFPAERILVLDQADLLHRRGELLARVFAFLGVDPGFSSPAFERMLNRAEDHRLQTALGRGVAESRAVAVVRELPLPDVLRRPLRRLVSRPRASPELPAQLRAGIADSLGEEVSWLREFTGMRFADWSV